MDTSLQTAGGVREQGSDPRGQTPDYLAGSLQVTGVHGVEAEVSEVPAHRLRLPQPCLRQGGVHALT